MPLPLTFITILNNQTVGRSLALECDVIAVRGITSRVDIVWSSNGVELNTIERINVSSVTYNSVLYTDTYIIPQLRTTDEYREYQCKISINTKLPVIATDSVILNVTGKHIIFMHSSNAKLLYL